MYLFFQELEYLKEDEYIRQKFNEILTFLEEKHITVEDISRLHYDKDTLKFELSLSVPIPPKK